MAAGAAFVITYSVAISACEQGQQWQQELHLLRHLQWSSLEIDVINYKVAISAYEKCKQ